MGNEFSTVDNTNNPNTSSPNRPKSSGYTEFFSSAGKTIGEASGIVCGSLNDTFEGDEDNDIKNTNKENLRRRSRRVLDVVGLGSVVGGGNNSVNGDDLLCGNGHFSPANHSRGTGAASMNTFANPDDDASLQTNPMSALFARALLNEVTDNPATMRPTEMTAREKKLIKAQERAKTASRNNLRAVGGQGTMKGHLNTLGNNASSRIMPPNLLSENRAQVRGEDEAPGKHRVTIGLMLSRREAKLGHSDTVTRQTAFDFNELQDRQYKYVSSTDSSGWKAGGGESGKAANPNQVNMNVSNSLSDDTDLDMDPGVQTQQTQQQSPKVAAQDTVHIPIMHIDCESSAAIDSVIAALARGEVFIPHMSVMPEALGVNGISPPDLVVRFGCERNDDMPPEEWPNWCLEFMHNQLYDYFSDMGAKWMKRPFQITLAKKVRWKTVKHMNKFFSHSENVIDAWREKGPQYLDPQPSYIEGGASPEEVARPHGIYLLRNGKPTNYFAPNFEPPYTTKMTRSLLLNVMSKSWDRKRRDWSSEPIARVTTSLLLSTMCGCADANDGGFIAREATTAISPYSVRSRTPSFFGGDKTNVSPSKAEYSPFKSKKKTIQPQLTQKAQEQQQRLYEGLKVKRDDSGIRRSQIQEPEKKDESRSRSESSSSRQSNNKSSNNGTKSKQKKSPQPSSSKDREQPKLPNQHLREEVKPLHENDDLAAEFDWMTPDKKIDVSIHDLDDEDFVMEAETPKNYFSPSQKETPTINNQFSRKNKNKYNMMSDNPTEDAIPEESPTNDNSKSPGGYEEVTKFILSEGQGQGSVNQDAGISIGESQTTVPTFNGSSAKFIEQERERRKERELQREKERAKIEKLERAIEEKNRMNQEKMSSAHQREKDTDKTKVSSERKSSKKEKKSKKDKKKREKKGKRERSKDSKISQKIENNSDRNVDWSKEPLSQQAVKENCPIKNDPQSFRENSTESKSKKSIEWSSDSSYLPLNLNGNNGTDSPSSNRHSIFNTHANSGANDINSQVSLDYSMDTASLLGGDASLVGDGSLIGGQFAGDGSVFTVGTSASDNKSLLSCVTRSTVHDMSGRNKTPIDPQPDQDDNDDISLSLMASTSSGMELIPTDEDLFAIGWAKAMDPSSGSYYYFTLDRSKTVWDNPLTTRPDP